MGALEMTMGRAIGRLILVPLACLLAIAVAAAVLLTLGLERATHVMHRGSGMSQIEELLSILEAMPRLGAAVSIIPAALLVIVGEVVRIRSLTYYVVGGGAVLAIIPLLGLPAGGSSAGPGLLEAGALWQVFATAGFAGGLVYWLVAGRRA